MSSSSFKITKSNLSKIITNPEIEANKMSVDTLSQLLIYAKEKYYMDNEIFDDDIFDTLEDNLKSRDPKNKYFKITGLAELKSSSKVKLPYNLGSMDKIKPNTKELDRYLSKYKGPYCISEKLDGLSGLLVYNHTNENDEMVERRLFRRGDGKYATDISHLIPYLNVPNLKEKIAVRGEFIISKKVFKNHYINTFPKARSFVSGLVNAKKPNPKYLKHLEFITYEVIYPEGIKPSQQFKNLEKIGFKTATYKSVLSVNNDILSETLINQKKNSNYEIDGIIVAQDTPYKRVSDGNPKHAVAFKMNIDKDGQIIEGGTETEVVEVQWNPSKYGTLKPKIKIKPVIIDGDTVTFITGNNAKYIQDNKIGPGAIVSVIKSGDVIPKVMKVIKQVKPQFPTNIKWHWNNTHVEIVMDESSSSSEVLVKKLINFFTVLKIPNINTGILNKLVENGFSSIKSICEMSKSDFMTLPGIKEKSATKLYESIHNVINNPIELHSIMSASGIFGHGFGERKLLPLTTKFPNIIKDYKKIQKSDIMSIEGFSDKSVEKFLKALPEFVEFITEHKFISIKSSRKRKLTQTLDRVGKFKKQIVLFSGVRNKDIVDYIESEGGDIVESMSSKVTLLIVKDKNANTGKIKKARENGIKIIQIDEIKM
jgi:NAD-dependent DNA ligase